MRSGPRRRCWWHVMCGRMPRRLSPNSLVMSTSHIARRKVKDGRRWYRQAVVTAVAVGCLLQALPSCSFLTHHHASSHPLSSRPLRSSSATATATMSATPQPQKSAATEAVYRASLESLVAETDPRKPVRSLGNAKKELLERVGYGTQAPRGERSQNEEERVGYLLGVLEGNYTPILTVGFFNFAAQVKSLGFSPLLVRIPCVCRSVERAGAYAG